MDCLIGTSILYDILTKMSSIILERIDSYNDFARDQNNEQLDDVAAHDCIMLICCLVVSESTSVNFDIAEVIFINSYCSHIDVGLASVAGILCCISCSDEVICFLL